MIEVVCDSSLSGLMKATSRLLIVPGHSVVLNIQNYFIRFILSLMKHTHFNLYYSLNDVFLNFTFKMFLKCYLCSVF